MHTLLPYCTRPLCFAFAGTTVQPMTLHPSPSLTKGFQCTLTLLLIACCQTANAQIKAITDTGSEVVLYEDGTWKYTEVDPSDGTAAIPENNKKFSKGKNSTFLVKSNKVDIGVWIDPKAWHFEKGTTEDAYEYQFALKGGDLYGMMIAEKTQIPIETLKTIAIGNAREAAPDVRVVKEEYRQVNGLKVLLMQMSGTIQGIKFTYYGYYYSNANGTIQFLTYTGADLFDDYADQIEVFLNGLVELGAK